MKINRHTAPIVIAVEFLMYIPIGKINSSTNKRQTNPKFFKSLKGYLNEFEIMLPKSIKSPELLIVWFLLNFNSLSSMYIAHLF